MITSSVVVPPLLLSIRSAYPISAGGEDGRWVSGSSAYRIKRTPVVGAPARSDCTYRRAVSSHTNVLPSTLGLKSAGIAPLLSGGNAWRRASPRRAARAYPGAVAPTRAAAGASPAGPTAGRFALIAVRLWRVGVFTTPSIACSGAAVVAGWDRTAARGAEEKSVSVHARASRAIPTPPSVVHLPCVVMATSL